MKIIIAGCGKIGSSVLANLSAEGHDITAIDTKSEIINELTGIYDVMGVTGSAVDQEILEEAGVENCGMFIAMTESDELNMLSCFLAKKMGAKNTVARIRNPEYNDRRLDFLRQNLELSMSINPELRTARELYNVLKFPSALKIETFSRRNLEMIEFLLGEDSDLAGKNLHEIRKKYDAQFLIACVERGDQVYIPNGVFRLEKGDIIGLVASLPEMQKLLKMLNSLRRQAKNILILGGSKTAYYLAKMFEGGGNTAKIIEQDEQRSLELTEALPKATIIHGDGAAQETLMEEGLMTCDAFVALTGIDEENILLGIYAAQQKVPKTIVKVNRDELASLAKKIGIESIVSPKEITSNILVQYARALENSSGSSVETLYKLFGGKAEALEFIVSGESKITGIPLKDLKLRPNILIAGIVRGRRIIIPSGSDDIEPSDRVVIISAGNRLSNLEDILL